jgi:hypothetical protein
MSIGFVTAEAHISAQSEESQSHMYLAGPSSDVLARVAAVKISAFCVKGLYRSSVDSSPFSVGLSIAMEK